jgi:DNA-binding response OmpR family regulator
MSTAAEILIVDDDPAIRVVFAHALRSAGFEVSECDDGAVAIERIKHQRPALVILDIEMPQLNGWETLQEFRRLGFAQPVLMITSLQQVESRIRGLDMGADDYLCKPCNTGELVARVRALLRRPVRPVEAGAVLYFGDLAVDLQTKTARRGDTAVKLSATDYGLLSLLREHVGKPVSRDLIVKTLWGTRADAVHALETHLWRLRKKLGESSSDARWIRNLAGIGYVLDASTLDGPH